MHLKVVAWGVKREIWLNVDGNDLATMTSLASYPDAPDEDNIVQVSRFQKAMGIAMREIDSLFGATGGGDYTF